MQPVYSLRVDTDDHSFLTNGFVSHNTEARLARIAEEMLRELDSDTVDFEPNYDESKQRAARSCRRGSRTCSSTAASGIAVGMATNIPPHNLGEVIDAVVTLIDKPEANVEDLMKHVKGPDFPTGAIIVGRSGIRDAYRTGRGRVVMRARAHIEELRGGKSAIIVTELPYGVKKGGDSGVIAKIAELVQRQGAHRDLGPAGSLRPVGDAHPDRAEARCGPAGRAQQALQAHAAAVDVRRQHRRARGRRAADALAARAAHALPRLPARDRHPPLEARAAPEGEARAHPAGLPDRARQPRRGDRAHPRGRRHRGREAGPDGRSSTCASSRRVAILELRLRAPDRARAQGGRGRVQGHRRSASTSCATCSAPRRRSTR